MNQIKKHKVLSKPILAAFLLMIWGYSIFFLESGIVGILMEDTGIMAIFLALTGLLLMVIHKLWFRPELTSIA